MSADTRGLQHCGCAYELVEDGAVQRKRWFHEPGCALAAGVGVPPPELQMNSKLDQDLDLVSAPAKERQDARVGIPLVVDAEDREMWCERCGRRHGVVWSAPSDVWNDVMREGARGNPDEFGFCCPTCFMQLADERGVGNFMWMVVPDPVKGPYRTVAGFFEQSASGASAAEGRKPETPAGVGEARPAEPAPTYAETQSTSDNSGGAPAEEQPDAREAAQRLLNEVAATAEPDSQFALDIQAVASECVRLRKQLHSEQRDRNLWAANNSRESRRLREQLDAARRSFERIIENLDGENEDGNIFPQAAERIARAALGDVAAGGYATDESTSHKSDEGGALGQKASETRADADKEAL